jgi:UDP-glucose 4-epimerase
MRVIVTGATGNVGTSLLAALDRDGRVDEIVGVARRVPDAGLGKITWRAADVAADDLRPIVRGADAVVHLAWLIQPSHDRNELWRVNVLGTQRVMDAVRLEGVGALVHASSVGAYSPGPRDRRVDESWPTDGIPSLPYSWHKAYVERMLDAFERHVDCRVVRMRPGLIFKREAAHRIRQLFIGPLLPRPFVRPGLLVGAVRRSTVPFQVVHSDDVATAFLAAVTSDAHGAFNVATEPVLGHQGSGARPLLAGSRALASAGWHLRVVTGEPAWIDLAGNVPLMDTGRARRELGWEPAVDAETTVRELLEGLRADARGDTPALSA